MLKWKSTTLLENHKAQKNVNVHKNVYPFLTMVKLERFCSKLEPIYMETDLQCRSKKKKKSKIRTALLTHTASSFLRFRQSHFLAVIFSVYRLIASFRYNFIRFWPMPTPFCYNSSPRCINDYRKTNSKNLHKAPFFFIRIDILTICRLCCLAIGRA